VQNFLSNLPHLVTATLVIAAAVVLAATKTITGGEAIALIAGAGGVSLGVGASNTQTTPAAPAAPAPPPIGTTPIA
jgi:hypothetical protein